VCSVSLSLFYRFFFVVIIIWLLYLSFTTISLLTHVPFPLSSYIFVSVSVSVSVFFFPFAFLQFFVCSFLFSFFFLLLFFFSLSLFFRDNRALGGLCLSVCVSVSQSSRCQVVMASFGNAPQQREYSLQELLEQWNQIRVMPFHALPFVVLTTMYRKVVTIETGVRRAVRSQQHLKQTLDSIISVRMSLQERTGEAEPVFDAVDADADGDGDGDVDMSIGSQRSSSAMAAMEADKKAAATAASQTSTDAQMDTEPLTNNTSTDNSMSVEPSSGEAKVSPAAATAAAADVQSARAPPIRMDPQNHYRSVRTLRSTIHGTIKLGYRKRDELKVAIKLSSLASCNSGHTLENPEEEIRIMWFLSNHNKGHPHVLRVLDVCQDTTHHWTILEFCDKGEFFDLVADRGAVPEPFARRYFRQFISGVHHLHQSKVCHLDLSLENILLNDQDQVKICDFGMARVVDDQKPFQAEPRNKPGKLGYMSPEIFANQQFDGRQADIYSAGVILFIMVTGTPPYERPTPQDKRFKLIYNNRLEYLLTRWGFKDRLTSPLRDLLQKLLAPPEHRLTLDQILAHPWVRSNDNWTVI
jgi:serine/threonine protein kinase